MEKFIIPATPGTTVTVEDPSGNGSHKEPVLAWEISYYDASDSIYVHPIGPEGRIRLVIETHIGG